MEVGAEAVPAGLMLGSGMGRQQYSAHAHASKISGYRKNARFISTPGRVSISGWVDCAHYTVEKLKGNRACRIMTAFIRAGWLLVWLSELTHMNRKKGMNP